MIRSFRCQETRAIHEGVGSRRFRGIEEQARKRLRWLDAATSLGDLGAIRGNHLEALKGTARVSTAFESTTVGGSASPGWTETLTTSRLWTTTERGRTMTRRRKLPPIHPGELLRDELSEIGVSLNELARALRVPMNRISAIVNGKRAITVDTAMRLARYFGTSPQYWLNLQNAYDLEVAGTEIGTRIEREVLPRSAA